VLTGIQDLAGTDRFYYKVAWSLDNSGKAPAWSKTIFGPDCGGTQAGGSANIADIDCNEKPDLVLTRIDSPAGANNFWCYMDWDIDINGNVTSWSSPKFLGPAVGYVTEGGGTAVGDIYHKGKMDILLMELDNPHGNDRYTIEYIN